jgi:hypothetical protein
MSEVEQLRSVVNDLIELMHVQAKELEALVTHVEQVTVHMPQTHQFSVVVSGLAALHHRIQKLGVSSEQKG